MTIRHSTVFELLLMYIPNFGNGSTEFRQRAPSSWRMIRFLNVSLIKSRRKFSRRRKITKLSLELLMGDDGLRHMRTNLSDWPASYRVRPVCLIRPNEELRAGFLPASRVPGLVSVNPLRLVTRSHGQHRLIG